MITLELSKQAFAKCSCISESKMTGELVAEADFFIVVTPEMNHTIAPGLVSVMSHFGSSHYQFKPSGIVTYSAGLWGGARAGIALRPFLSELGCLPVSSMVAIPGAVKTMGGVSGDEWADSQEMRAWTKKAAEDLGLPESEQDAPRDLPGVSSKMLDRMLDQLEWQARTNCDARSRDGPPSASYFEEIRKGTNTCKT